MTTAEGTTSGSVNLTGLQNGTYTYSVTIKLTDGGTATGTASFSVNIPAPGHLYWANSGNGTIMEANLDGTNPQTIVTGQSNPVGIAVDAQHLYWTNGGNGLNGTIVEANLDGTNPQTIVTGQGLVGGIAVSG